MVKVQDSRKAKRSGRLTKASGRKISMQRRTHRTTDQSSRVQMTITKEMRGERLTEAKFNVTTAVNLVTLMINAT